eukprot:1803671-Amphidinium_carterae.2
MALPSLCPSEDNFERLRITCVAPESKSAQLNSQDEALDAEDSKHACSINSFIRGLRQKQKRAEAPSSAAAAAAFGLGFEGFDEILPLLWDAALLGLASLLGSAHHTPLMRVTCCHSQSTFLRLAFRKDGRKYTMLTTIIGSEKFAWSRLRRVLIVLSTLSCIV